MQIATERVVRHMEKYHNSEKISLIVKYEKVAVTALFTNVGPD